MYFKFQCEHCGKSLKVREELAGRKARCPYCHNAVSVPTETDEAPSEMPYEEPRGETPQQDDATKVLSDAARQPPSVLSSRPAARRGKKKRRSGGRADQTDGTNVSLLLSGLIGAGVAAGFLLLMWPFYDFYLGQLFLNRGWVPWVLVFLMGWSGAILVLKSRKLARQRESMLFDLLPTELSEEITVATLDKFADHVRGLPAEPGESFLITRVLRGLEHFRVRRSAPEVASMLASQSEIDATAVESSYSMLKVFIWAIPILGFIGTVIGISGAVDGFDLEGAGDIADLKSSLGDVTGGLATAFDTTLVALVLSLLVMFPASSMQKAEEDLLNWVDEYCNENLLRRLLDGGAPSSGGGDNKADIQTAINAAMADHHAELKSWSIRLESIGSSLTQRVAGGWESIQKRLQSQHQEQVEQLGQHAGALAKQQRDLLERFASIQTELTGLQESQLEQTQASIQQLADRSQGAQAEITQSMRAAAESLNAYFAGLEQGLGSLNRVLESLGEKQVVIKTEGAPRRRWGFFGRRNGK